MLKPLQSIFASALLLASVVSTTASAKEVTLGLAIPYFGQEYWATLQKGAEEEAAKRGVKLVVTELFNDPTKQTAQIEAFIASKVDAILLPPANPQALVPAVEAANKAGIPVITVDTNVAGGQVKSFVASNNVTVGKIAAEYVIGRLGSGGKVFIGSFPQNQSTLDRVTGFKEALAKAPNIQIAGEEALKLLPDTIAQAEAVLTSYSDINAMFGIADVMTLPFWKVAKERGLNEKIFFVGVDATKEGLDAVAENSGYAGTVAQQPALMGGLAVETALKVINGETVPEYTEVPVSLVTSDNIKDFVK